MFTLSENELAKNLQVECEVVAFHCYGNDQYVARSKIMNTRELLLFYVDVLVGLNESRKRIEIIGKRYGFRTALFQITFDIHCLRYTKR